MKFEVFKKNEESEYKRVLWYDDSTHTYYTLTEESFFKASYRFGRTYRYSLDAVSKINQLVFEAMLEVLLTLEDNVSVDVRIVH